MKPISEKKCPHCNRLFWPDRRNTTRQEYCSLPECRRASKAASQEHWLGKPENRNYFCGSTHIQRVQQWRKDHPGYWRRKSYKTDIALQDPLITQPVENTFDTAKLASSALQDLVNSQPIVLLGLIANLTGSALQDDMAATVRRLLQLGQDIINNPNLSQGGHYGIQKAHLPQTGTTATQTVQLAGSPSGP
jgi:hypothetical protein